MTGASLGSYRLLNKIGEGGMGAVYEAEHVLLGRRAAVKLLHSLYTTRPDIVHRFFNEARATSAIDHPSMVQIFDFGYHTDGTAYIVMELLRGQSLGARLAGERRLPPEIAVGIARQIAGGLAAAHAHGIVHRDLKPDNLFLAPDREVAGGLRVKILDFGIAKLAQAAAIQHRTRTGTLMGTPAYMAPEQCRGAGVVDGRADVYALGCILFEMICGQPPFAGEGPGDVLVAQITLPPPPPSQFVMGLDPRLHAFIMKCLEKLPQARPRSMAEAEAELEKFYEPGRPISHPDQAMASWRSGPPLLVPTTLSAATGQSISTGSTVPKPPRKRGGLYVAAGVAAAMGVGGLVAFLAGRPSPRSAVAPEPVAVADAAGALTVTAVDAGNAARQTVAGRGEPDAEVVADPPDTPPARVELDPPPAPPRVARPERLEITIQSEPPGAEVVIDGRVWGRTTFRAAFERDKIPQHFVLRCEGYDEVQGTLSPARRRHTVKLERQPDTPLGAKCK